MEDIIRDLKAVQDFIKKDDEHCPDYSVTKNVYVAQIQYVIDKHTESTQPARPHVTCDICGEWYESEPEQCQPCGNEEDFTPHEPEPVRS